MTMTDILTNRYHSCSISVYGDWRISSKDVKIHLADIAHLLTKKRLKMVDHENIAWKGMNLLEEYATNQCICCKGERYRNCDFQFPGILVENAPNPFNLKFRMIDGKHRIAKMRKMGIFRSLYYVIPFKNFKKHCHG